MESRRFFRVWREAEEEDVEAMEFRELRHEEKRQSPSLGLKRIVRPKLAREAEKEANA